MYRLKQKKKIARPQSLLTSNKSILFAHPRDEALLTNQCIRVKKKKLFVLNIIRHEYKITTLWLRVKKKKIYIYTHAAVEYNEIKTDKYIKVRYIWFTVEETFCYYLYFIFIGVKRLRHSILFGKKKKKKSVRSTTLIHKFSLLIISFFDDTWLEELKKKYIYNICVNHSRVIYIVSEFFIMINRLYVLLWDFCILEFDWKNVNFIKQQLFFCIKIQISDLMNIR